VINLTGVILHTNLGRAPLGAEVAAAVHAVACGYSNTELDLEGGQRGGRLAGVGPPLCALVGAEAALAVNNNAAAVLLTLTALARGREVLVSRGELVEIGGSFRVPDIIADGGARLVEVGTTNRTRVSDFERAITPETALILRVHPSNFRQVGFVERADRRALVALGQARGVPVVEDLGAGLIGPLPAAVEAEEAVEAALADGVDLVCFSGDKLLGGPQAGLIAGRAALVSRLREHPLYRALRLDKLVLAALEATLRLYTEGREAELPVRQMFARSADDCRRVAERLAAALPGAVVEADVGWSGGGALPGEALPTSVVALRVDDPGALAARLRRGEPAVLVRVSRGAVLLDPRTLLPGEEPALSRRLSEALAESGNAR
jgi:L-seryl-tRNA(Ser) seleniumtransferase